MLLVSGLVLALYAWAFFVGFELINQSLLVSDYAAIAAGVVFTYAAMTYIWSPRKLLRATSIFGFLLVVAMVALLIQDTGYLSSPFIALWMLAALFAPIFGLYGIIAIVSAVGIYIGALALIGGLDFEAVALSTLLGLLPRRR